MSGTFRKSCKKKHHPHATATFAFCKFLINAMIGGFIFIWCILKIHGKSHQMRIASQSAPPWFDFTVAEAIRYVTSKIVYIYFNQRMHIQSLTLKFLSHSITRTRVQQINWIMCEPIRF